MVLERINYFVNGKKKKINAKVCKTPLKKFLGLMFKKNSPPLLFIFKKEKNLTVHSFFCKPFKAIWLDKNMSQIKSLEVKDWRLNLSGRGNFLLEIPKNY